MPKDRREQGAGGKAREVRLGLVQMACSAEPGRNLERALAGIDEAAREGAQVICLQELFRTLYFCQTEDHAVFDLAEPVSGPTTAALAGAARRRGVAIIGSIDADGSLAGIYRKMHIPDDPLYYEKFYFTPGDTGFVAFATRPARVGALVCWDQWYPEAARLTALRGAEILFYPTAIGWHHSEKAEHGEAQHQAWETMQRAHAISNGVFVAAVNRVGTEGGLEFWGASFVSDPFGRILARASSTKEETLVVSCDLARIEEVRRNWPFLRDRRIDAYGAITSRFLDPEDPA
jgi:N-carbamoylputrescine amidase